MANLKLNHIYKVYPNGAKAVNDFTMEIEDKEFIVFVGPSGCGKSTTLRMIAGIEEITAGELYIGDAYMNYVAPKNRDIAMVFQNYALYPHMTVYDNMAFGLKLRKLPKSEIDRRVKEAAEILGITEYLDRKPKAMSGGQRQRVALGRAIVREPKVFLLDEPLSNLDAKLRTAMRAEISKLHRRLQTTFIYVTHDQTEAMTMGTRIVVMKDGYVQQIDTPRNLYRYPCNKFVAGFIGTPQMNFFTGRLKKVGDKVEVTLDGTNFALCAPMEYFLKVNPKYLDGQTQVTIGLRAEHITTNVNEFPYVTKCRVMNVEELGVNNQVYADFNLEASDIAVEESPTRVILRAPAGSYYATGDVIDVSVDLSEIHIFDMETGETAMPRIPEFAQIEATVSAGALQIGEEKLPLPPALAVQEGNYEVVIPNSAVKIGGQIKAKIVSAENVNGTTLLILNMQDKILFMADANGASYEVGDTTIDIDVKQISLLSGGNMVAHALQKTNQLEGTILKTKTVVTESVGGKEKQVKKWTYEFFVGEHKFPCSKSMADMIFANVSDKICGCGLSFMFPYTAAKISEQGMEATVEQILNYGDEKFALCRIGQTQVVVGLDSDAVSTNVRIDVDVDALSVTEPTMGIKLI